MLILMAAAGGVPEIEVPEGVDQRAHPHGGQIIGQTLGLPFVAGEHQGAAAGTGAQGAEKGRFMDGGEPRDGSREPAGVDGLFQLLQLGEGRQGPGEEFHHWKALLSILLFSFYSLVFPNCLFSGECPLCPSLPLMPRRIVCGSKPRGNGIYEWAFFPRKRPGCKSRVVGLGSPKLPFLWEGSHSPSLPLMPRRGTPFSPWMRKGGKRIIWGWHLDTPSEIILQASLRMHFDGGQGRCSFLADSVAELSA